MAKVNITALSYLHQHSRLDSEFFQKEYLILDEKVGHGESILKIADTVDLQSNGAFKVIFDILSDNNEKVVPYIRSGNVGDFFVTKDDLHLISALAHSKLPKTHTREGDIIMARKGKIGGATIITSDDIGYNSNDNVANIRLKDFDYNPWYFVTFWNCKYGLKQVERYATGNVQPWLSMKQVRMLKTVKLPMENQLKIEALTKNAYYKQKQSKELYSQATQLLDDALGLNTIEFKKEKSYTASASGIAFGKRADAEFFNPKLRQYWNHLEVNSGVELVPITQFCSVTKFGNPDYASSGTPIITQKHLGDISPKDFGTDPIASNSWVSKYTKAILQQNDLLFYSVGAYLGKTNIWFNSETAVPASFITLLRPYTEADAGYLMVLLNSQYGILQSKVFQSGTSQQYIYPKDIRRFKVPAIADELKQELYDLLKRSYNSKNESLSLLEQAKQEVETLIEQAAQTA